MTHGEAQRRLCASSSAPLHVQSLHLSSSFLRNHNRTLEPRRYPSPCLRRINPHARTISTSISAFVASLSSRKTVYLSHATLPPYQATSSRITISQKPRINLARWPSLYTSVQNISRHGGPTRRIALPAASRPRMSSVSTTAVPSSSTSGAATSRLPHNTTFVALSPLVCTTHDLITSSC